MSVRAKRQAWLALSALAGIALLLGGGVWALFRADHRAAILGGFRETCLLISQSIVDTFWSWLATHPLTAGVSAVLLVSMVWALVRLGTTLLAEWRLGRRLSRYDVGQFAVLDQALRLTPEVERGRVRIIHSSTPDAFTLGVIRPKICLSLGLLRSMSEAEVLAVVRHEHAHAKARDPLRLATVRLFSDFLWFLPVTRYVAEAFSRLAELSADEEAVAAGSDSIELASAIVKTARAASPAPRFAPAAVGIFEVEERITRLLGRERTTGVRLPWGRALASGLMVATMVALLVGPTLGTAGAGGPDPRATTRSMMECTPENGMVQPMDGCADPGPLSPGVRKSYAL
jgi:Zn-dependent protease with chaperone function